MDAYDQFIEVEKQKAKVKAGRGRLAPKVEALISQAMEYAEKVDKVKLLRKQVLEIGVRGYWEERLNKSQPKHEE